LEAFWRSPSSSLPFTSANEVLTGRLRTNVPVASPEPTPPSPPPPHPSLRSANEVLKELLPTKRVGSGPTNSQRTGQVFIQVHISDPIPDPEIEGEYYPVVSCLIPDPETMLEPFLPSW
jgi:hypothetical protein